MMKKYFREVDGLRTEFLESGSGGPAVFIFHGNSSCADLYESLLCSPLGQKYRLIAVSFPGHGKSAYFNEPDAAVTIAGLGALTARVTRSFGIDSYALVGQSLGGHALLEALQLHRRACGLFLVSAPPISLPTLGEAFAPDPIDGLLFKNQLSAMECERFARAIIHRDNSANLALLCRHIGTTDGRFRAALGAGLAAGHVEDEIAALANATIPVAVVHGAQDKFLRLGYYATLLADRLWSGQVQTFDDCGHAVMLDQPERFSRLLERFLDDLFTMRPGAPAARQESAHE